MGRYLVRDPATHEIEIDETALPFWQDRPGYTVIGPVPELGAAPTEGSAPPEGSGNPAESTVGGSLDKSPATRKTSTNAAHA